MNKTSQIKTHFDSKIIGFFIIIFIFSCTLLLIKKKMLSDCDISEFKIEASSYREGALITFSDESKKSSDWQWTFGDGSKVSYLSKVSHAFDRAGSYKIKLVVNDGCTIEKTITILPFEDKKDYSLLPKFEAPSAVIKGQSVYFKDLTGHAKSWEWRFGESGGSVDATDKNPSYVFKTSGRKVVSLVVNGDVKNVKQKEIFVKEPVIKTSKEPVIVIPKKRQPIEPGITLGDNLERALIGVAQNKLSYRNFARYFCKDGMPTVINKDGKSMSLKEFDEEIREKDIKIKKVTFQQDKDGCVTSITVNYKLTFF
jgi:PKD domain